MLNPHCSPHCLPKVLVQKKCGQEAGGPQLSSSQRAASPTQPWPAQLLSRENRVLLLSLLLSQQPHRTTQVTQRRQRPKPHQSRDYWGGLTSDLPGLPCWRLGGTPGKDKEQKRARSQVKASAIRPRSWQGC